MLKGYQKMFLRKIANEFNPAVIIGQHGLTDSVLKAIEEALFVNEVIKIKFSDFKEKIIKKESCEFISDEEARRRAQNRIEKAAESLQQSCALEDLYFEDEGGSEL